MKSNIDNTNIKTTNIKTTDSNTLLDINISNLFGKKITCTPSTAFILLNIRNPLDGLTRLDNQENSIYLKTYEELSDVDKTQYYNKKQYDTSRILNSRTMVDNDSIWEVNMDKIRNVMLEQYNIDLSKYETISDLWFPTSVFVNPISILLGNRLSGFIKCPNSYTPLVRYKNGTIWQPDTDKDYSPIGFVFDRTNPVFRSWLLRNDLIIPYEGIYYKVNNVTSGNEFNMLSTIDVTRLTLNRTKFVNNSENFRLKSVHNDKYLTDFDDRIGTYDVSYDNRQKIEYTTKGELKIKEKCLSIPTDMSRKNNFVYVNECNNSLGQKWYPFNSHIVSQYDKSCLSIEGDYITKKLCTDNDVSQMWKIDSRDDSEINNNVEIPIKPLVSKFDKDYDYKFNKEGKHVVLTHSDNPWYLGKNTTAPSYTSSHHSDYVNNKLANKNLYELNYKKYDNSAVKTNIHLDMDREFTGYGLGYSYDAKKMKPCGCTKNCANNFIHDINLDNLLTLADQVDTIPFIAKSDEDNPSPLVKRLPLSSNKQTANMVTSNMVASNMVASNTASSNMVSNKPAANMVSNKPAANMVSNKPAANMISNKPAANMISNKPAANMVSNKQVVSNKPSTLEYQVPLVVEKQTETLVQQATNNQAANKPQRDWWYEVIDSSMQINEDGMQTNEGGPTVFYKVRYGVPNADGTPTYLYEPSTEDQYNKDTLIWLGENLMNKPGETLMNNPVFSQKGGNNINSRFCQSIDNSYCSQRICCTESNNTCGVGFKSCIARVDTQSAKDKDVSFTELVDVVGTQGNCKKTVSNEGKKQYICSYPIKIIENITNQNVIDKNNIQTGGSKSMGESRRESIGESIITHPFVWIILILFILYYLKNRN